MKKLSILFPGQGSQYVGMGKKFYEQYPVARKIFNEASDVLGFNISQLCFEGNPEELTRTENAQPAILTVSVAMFEVFREEIKVVPRILAGHSLGEISALTCAGAIKFADSIQLIRQRGLLMRDAMADSEGIMAAVTGINQEIVQSECAKINTGEKVVVISNYNSPNQVVISGHKQAVEEVSTVLENQGAKVIQLKVSAPFHSPLMRPAADKFAVELKKYNYQSLKYPVISNVTGMPYPDSSQIVPLLTEQLVKPVRWQESMSYLQKQGIEIAVEIGPQTVLRNLMKSNASQIKSFSYDKEDDFKSLKEVDSMSAAMEVASKNEFQHTVVTKCIQIAVCTRNRNWDNDEYQKGVVEPYRKIQKIQEELEKNNQQPTLDQMKEALEMLRSVFITKKVPGEEQMERFNEVFDTTGTRHLFPEFDRDLAV